MLDSSEDIDTSLSEVHALWRRVQLRYIISDVDMIFVAVKPKHHFTMDTLIEGKNMFILNLIDTLSIVYWLQWQLFLN